MKRRIEVKAQTFLDFLVQHQREKLGNDDNSYESLVESDFAIDLGYEPALQASSASSLIRSWELDYQGVTDSTIIK